MGSRNILVQLAQAAARSLESTGLRVPRLAAALVVGMTAWGAGQAAPPPEWVKGRVIVQARAGLTDADLDMIVRVHGAKATRIGRSDLHIVDLPNGASDSGVQALLARHPMLKFAERDRVVRPTATSNDPYLGSEWHLGKIGAPTAWDAAQGAGVTIAILDTGVDPSHPDLANRLVAGWNVYDNNANTSDVYGHGTKVAGSAAAIFNNGTGVAGVAGNAAIMPIRISATDGSATLSAMAQGLMWAADHGARVANISYLCADSSAVISAANYMKNKGGLVTTAAGNYGIDEGIAATSSMIPVSATDGSDVKASWSSFGAYVAMSAPGVGIYTTTNGGGYGAVSGTSFASPVTAGAVALVMSANPKLSSGEVEKLLYATALDLGTAGRDTNYGYGRVDTAAAVAAALSYVSTADTTAPTASISAPLDASTVGGLVPVSVTATDNVGVTKVELRVNGSLVATDTASPFGFSWDSTKAANGTANLVATAYDAAGNAGNSATVAVNVSNVVVADTVAPTVTIGNPKNGATVSGNVSISVAASDNSGAAGIRQSLIIDGTTVATATGGSLSYNWNTRKARSGTHTLQAVASDAAGNTATQVIAVSK